MSIFDKLCIISNWIAIKKEHGGDRRSMKALRGSIAAFTSNPKGYWEEQVRLKELEEMYDYED